MIPSNDPIALRLLGWWVLLGLLLLWTFWSDRPLGGSRFRAVVLVGLVVFSLCFSAVGEHAQLAKTKPYPQGSVGAWADSVYVAVQNLAQNGEALPTDNARLRAGRLAGNAAAVLIAYEAIIRLFAGGFRKFKLLTIRRHTIVCGMGRIGSSLIRDVRKAIVIERDPAHPGIKPAEEAGVAVVIGDATDPELLIRAGAYRARDIFFVSGSNESNMEAAFNLLPKMPPRLKTRVLVHLTNMDLDPMLRRVARPAGVELRSFDVVDRAIRILMDGPVFDGRPRVPGTGTAAADYEVAHYVVVGFGEVGQQLALRLAELCHFENFKRSRMTIVYRREERSAVNSFQQSYPAMFPPPTDKTDAWNPPPHLDHWGDGVQIAKAGSLTPGDVGVTFVANGGFAEFNGNLSSDVFVDRVIANCVRPGVRLMVFVCRESEEIDCVQATGLRDQLDLRLKRATTATATQTPHKVMVFAYVPARPMLTRVVAGENKKSDLMLFGDYAEVCQYHQLKTDLVRPLAEAIANAYDAANAPANAVVRNKPLDERATWEQQSNLMAAAHMNIKLRLLGYKVEPRDARSRREKLPPLQPTCPAHRLGIVAHMEHNRWLAERLLSGWRFGAKDTQVENKCRLSIVDWALVPQSDRDKDMDQVLALLTFCGDPTRGGREIKLTAHPAA